MGRALEPEFVGRTYDDFLFRPQASPLASRRDVPLRTALTRRLGSRSAAGLREHGQRHRRADGGGDGARGGPRVRAPGPEHRGPGGRGRAREADPGSRRRPALRAGPRRERARGAGARAAAQRHRPPDRGGAGQRHPGRAPVEPGLAVEPGAGRPARRGVHDAVRPARDGPAGHLDRGGGAADVRPAGREAAARRRRPADPRPHHQEGHPGGAPPALLEQGRARPPPRGRGHRRARRFPRARSRAARRGRGRPPDRHRPRALGGHAARGGGGPGPLRATSASCAATSRPPRAPRSSGTWARTRSRSGSAPAADAGRGSRRGRAYRSSRPSGRRGAPSRTRCRSSPMAACARTRTCSWRWSPAPRS